MKMKFKVTTAILMSLFLVSILAVSTHAKPTEPTRLLMIDIMAKGDDLDLPGATTSIKGRIEFDEVIGVLLGQVEFHIKIYDDSGKKVYSMQGKLKNGMVIPDWYFDCDVREVNWTNLWLVMGPGMIKTTDIDLVWEYRGEPITLPNTEGKWSKTDIVMLVSPIGEHLFWVEDGNGDGYWEERIWPEGGWAFAGLYQFTGGVTYLTKYMEKWVP